MQTFVPAARRPRVGQGPVGSKLDVAYRVVGDVHTAFPQEFAFSVIEPASVCRNCPGGQNAALIEQCCRSFPMLENAVMYFFFCLGQVYVDRDVPLAGK